jgi:uncharacterized protein YigE (DUF2233 family)
MKTNYSFLWLIAACCFGGCGEVPPVDAPARTQPTSAGAQHTSYVADTFLTCTAAPTNIRLFWKDREGRILGSLGAVRHYTEDSGDTLRFAMNAGMYTEDQQPLGLFIQGGKTLRRLNRDTGYGNFYLRPNGVFFITEGGTADVCTTPDFPTKRNVQWATQSGPMLLIDGRIHPAFKQGSLNLNIRNGVGILPSGDVLLGIATVPVNLWDFAQAFKARGCKNALYLDGAISRAYFPQGGLEDTGGAFGVIIGVTK